MYTYTMDLHLTLALSNSLAYNASTKTRFPNTKKRSFSQLLQHAEEMSSNINGSDVVFPTLSLLPLTPGHSDHHDHDHEHSCNSSTSTITKRGEDDEEALVGWPPVYHRRKKHRYNEDHVVSRNYVKVKMEGEGIARKVNLSMHHSFHTLNHTLLDMFGKLLTGDDDQKYELVYQDKEGDWLLAQDVSWRSFMECAQRLKLLKRRG
ncbi:auxin-induced protein AUX22-like [Vicia villosa]|uniref:auxin-induced protein AUX22-like n=1 Tax=Vicia villosa TaxID=3911 RepID=UPI00273C700C|nr:auxin-induced protein AUX22-like [Vicia villosa]